VPRSLGELGPGLTLDTGALIAFDRRHRGALTLIRTAIARGIPIRIPAVVVAEFWRQGHPRETQDLIRLRTIPVDRVLAQRAGESLAAVPRGPSAIDALVAALADAHGDDVLSSDPGDLEALREHFKRIGSVTRL
jgi:predicted nucleic acid-binding protein